jgi:hypothetical protein
MDEEKKFPMVSVIVIGTEQAEYGLLQSILALQTYQDYEFICETDNRISDAWQRAVARARGEILVFLAPGARPVDNRWLEELVAGVSDERTIVKGLEVTSSPLDPSSLAGYRQAFLEHPFDENFPWSEDTELFCRLKSDGYRFVQLECAPVIHLSKPGSRTYRRRAFRYGVYWSRLRHRYAEPVELAGGVETFKEIVKASLYLLGMAVGAVLYWPEGRRWQASRQTADKDLGKGAR